MLTQTNSGVFSFFYNSKKSLLFYTLLLLVGSCQPEPPDPEIIKLDEKEAARQAKEIENSVSYQVVDSLKVSLWASEKLLQDPIGLDVDDKGDIYINVTHRNTGSEFDIRNHRDWMIESMSWDEPEDRKKFIHKELAPENSDKNRWLTDHNADSSHDWRDLTVQQEEIFKLKDQSGDGIADFSQLYMRNFNTEISDVAGTVFSYKDNVYIGVAPHIWQTKDTNNDGIADSKKSISEGYMVHIGFSGHGVSGLTMGPDGRLYWGIGDIGFSITAPDGTKWHYPNQGAIFRSEPDGSNFEVFARGVRNTHEFVFDKYGNLISVDNDGDHPREKERVVYLVNGSDSGWRINWQFGKYIDPKNNDYKVWMDENYFKPRFENQAAHLLPPIALYHSGPAGMAYNPGTALNDHWDDTFFISEFTGSPARSAIHGFKLKPKGASFELSSTRPVVEGILTTGIDFGPDGALYFADWIEGWDTKAKGRIWRLDAPAQADSEIRQETAQLLGADFEPKSSAELLELLHHEDMRVRMKSQFELVRRKERETLLKAVAQTDHQLERLHGIWGIGQLAREEIGEAEPLVPYLNDPDPEIQAHIARILGDVRYKKTAEKIIPLLKHESPRVQFFATEALGRMKYEAAFDPIVDMLEANNDVDVYLRHGGAIALARIGNVSGLAALADHPSEAVRIAAVVALRRLEAPEVARFLQDKSEFVVTNAARAINDDKMLKKAIPDLAELLEQKQFTNEPLIRRAVNANLYSGTAEAAQRLADFSLRTDIDSELRAEALDVLSVWPDPSILDRVTGRYRGEISNNKNDAVEALASIIEPILDKAPTEVKVAVADAVGSLAYRPAADNLFNIIETGDEPDIKIAALTALDALNYKDMGQAVSVAVKDRQSSVRMTAIGIIPELDIPQDQKVNLLSTVLGRGTVAEQQSALTAIGRMQGKAAVNLLEEQLLKLIKGELQEEIRLELVKAVEQSNSDGLLALLDQYRAQKEKGDIVAKYRESLYGGDPREGARIFYRNETAQCARCHAIDGRGGNVGPDLANIGNQLTRKQLLQSLVAPDERIAPGYGSVSITLENGDTFQGVLNEETDSYLVIQTGEGELHTIQKANISERTNSPSAMFSMAERLTRSQIRDLVAFLSQQKGD